MKLFIKIPPPITAILLIIVAHLITLVFPEMKVVFFKSLLLAALFMLVGIGIIAWSFILFQIKRTTLNPNKKPQKMIISGPYRLSRNPMYLGLLLLLLGYALWRGEIIFLIPPVVFFFLMDKVVIPFEEKLVKEGMGDKYENYLKTVRKWL